MYLLSQYLLAFLLGGIIFRLVAYFFFREKNTGEKQECEKELSSKKYDGALLSIIEKQIGENFHVKKIAESIISLLDGSIEHSTASYLLYSQKDQSLLFGSVAEQDVDERFIDEVKQKMKASLSVILNKDFSETKCDESVVGKLTTHSSGVGSFINIPLILFGEPIGVFNIASTNEGVYTYDKVLEFYIATNKFLEAVSRIQGMIGKEAQFHNKMEQEFKRRIYQTEVLKELSERIGYSLDLAKIIEIITGSVGQLLEYHVIAYVVQSDDKIIFKCDIEEPVNHAFIADVKGKMIQSFSALLGRPLKNEDVDESLSGSILSDELHAPVSSFFNLPLIIGGKAVGLITVASPKSGLYNEEETAVLYTIANQASTAVTRLHEVLEREKGKLNSLVTSLDDGIIMFDPHWTLQVINTQGRKLLDLTDEEIGLYDVLEKLSGKIDIRTQVEKAIAHKTEIPSSVITLGDKILQVVILQVNDKENEHLGVVVVFHDITEASEARKIIEEKASELETLNTEIQEQKESAESILRFLRSIGEGIFATDTEGKIMFMNDAAEAYSGQSFNYVEGKNYSTVFNFIGEDNAEFLKATIEKVIKEKKGIAFPEKIFFSVGEKKIPISGTSSPIFDEKKTLTGVITVFQDITKKHELEQMKNSFLTVAAHKLRTPLGSMRWTMELLLNGDLGALSPEAKEGITEVYENSQRMLTLLNALLDVSEMDKKQDVEAKKSIDIVELLKKVIKKMEPEAKKYTVKIDLAIPAEKVKKVMIPPLHTEEAFENLLSNSIKYNHLEGEVMVSVENSTEGIVVKVKDTGIGIPKEDHEKIFSKFFRSANAASKETEGSGLGLSVVKSYLEEAGASIDFESEENVGTTFTVKFPLKSGS